MRWTSSCRRWSQRWLHPGWAYAERSSHGFARLTAVDGGDVTVELAADARIRPVDSGPLGPVLSLEELGADKLLALFDRAQARDFVDVTALVERFGLERLCELASEKDSGFSRSVLVDMLRGFRRFAPKEFGLSKDAYEDSPGLSSVGATSLASHRRRSTRPARRSSCSHSVVSVTAGPYTGPKLALWDFSGV
jgi:hypothetical protein